MRTIHVDRLTENIKEMCIEANHYLSKRYGESDASVSRAGGVSSWETDPEATEGKSRDCWQRYDSNMPGHWNGSDFFWR